MKGFKFGWLSGFGMLVGVVGLGVSALAALGIVMEWEIELADTPLPDTWGSLLGLVAACGLICVLSLYGAFMRGKFQAAKGKPMVRVALVVIGLGLLVLAGRGVQVVALTMSYGSMLAYYATDGDLEDVAAEIEKGPKPEHLDAAIGRAAQYDNVGALKLLLKAGADFRDATEPEERQHCALSGSKVGLEFTQIAVQHGATRHLPQERDPHPRQGALGRRRRLDGPDRHAAAHRRLGSERAARLREEGPDRAEAGRREEVAQDGRRPAVAPTRYPNRR